MKNKEIFDFRSALDELSDIKGKTFAYAVFKNKQLLDAEIEIVNQLRKQPSQDVIDYENERQLLCIKHADKDDNGDAVINYNPNGTQSYQISDLEKFQKEHDKISAKYKDAIDENKKDQDEFIAYLEKESEVEVKKVKIDDLPEDVTAGFMEKIQYMLE